MNVLSQPPIADVIPLTDQLHQRVEQLCPNALSIAESDSLYLNLLSVHVVQHWLVRLGYYSRCPVETMVHSLGRSLLNVAPVKVFGANPVQPRHPNDGPDYRGCLECCVVRANDQEISIPMAAVYGDRVGYIAVQFDDELNQAHLLGFVDQTILMAMNYKTMDYTDNIPNDQSDWDHPVNSNLLHSVLLNSDVNPLAHGGITVSLEQLEPLDNLCQQLDAHNSQMVIRLGQWFDHQFQQGWEAIATILQPHQLEMVPVRTRRSPGTRVERGCIVTLGDRRTQIAVVMNIEKASSSEYAVGIQFWPAEGTYLPNGLQLAILDDQDQAVLEAQTRDNHQTLEMTFVGETNDCFGIRIASRDASITKQFLL